MRLRELTRRRLLRCAGTVVLLGAALPRDAAAQQQPAAAALLQRIANGRPLQQGRVRLRLPEIAENGNTVPITVTVESPMTAGDHVRVVHVVSAGNPRPEAFVAHFSPASGKAEVSTRMRAARTMNVIACAEMSDGSLWAAQTEARVTIGGCGG